MMPLFTMPVGKVLYRLLYKLNNLQQSMNQMLCFGYFLVILG